MIGNILDMLMTPYFLRPLLAATVILWIIAMIWPRKYLVIALLVILAPAWLLTFLLAPGFLVASAMAFDAPDSVTLSNVLFVLLMLSIPLFTLFAPASIAFLEKRKYRIALLILIPAILFLGMCNYLFAGF